LEELLSYIKAFKTLNKMAIQDKATLKGYFQTGDTPNESNFSDLIDTQFNGLSVLPLRCITKLTQSGTDSPSAFAILNQLGDFSITRIDPGKYIVTFSSFSWNMNYAAVFINGNSSYGYYIYSAQITDTNEILITTCNLNHVDYQDDMLNNATLDITIFWD